MRAHNPGYFFLGFFTTFLLAAFLGTLTLFGKCLAIKSPHNQCVFRSHLQDHQVPTTVHLYQATPN